MTQLFFFNDLIFWFVVSCLQGYKADCLLIIIKDKKKYRILKLDLISKDIFILMNKDNIVYMSYLSSSQYTFVMVEDYEKLLECSRYRALL